VESPAQPEPRAARAAFNRVARTAGEDVVAREAGRRMAARLDYVSIEARRVLDAGSGLAGDVPSLHARYPRAQIVALDAAVEMAHEARRRRSPSERLRSLFGRPAVDFACADMSCLPFPENAFSLVWSNLALGWAPDPLAVFGEFHRVLEPGGLLMFSAYGPDTLKELRRAFEQCDRYPHVHPFIDMHDLGDMLVAAGLAEPVMDMEMLTLTYEGVSALWDDLRRNGLVNVVKTRRRGLLGRNLWSRMVQAYEGERRDGRIPATMEIVYGHAWKPKEHSRRRAAGPAALRFDPGAGRRKR
jgi:malonyl-CoA O-methyltransferase